jgi:hypothetical protein
MYNCLPVTGPPTENTIKKYSTSVNSRIAACSQKIYFRNTVPICILAIHQPTMNTFNHSLEDLDLA